MRYFFGKFALFLGKCGYVSGKTVIFRNKSVVLLDFFLFCKKGSAFLTILFFLHFNFNFIWVYVPIYRFLGYYIQTIPIKMRRNQDKIVPITDPNKTERKGVPQRI